MHNKGPEGPCSDSLPHLLIIAAPASADATCAQWCEGHCIMKSLQLGPSLLGPSLLGPSLLLLPCIARFGGTNLIAQTTASGTLVPSSAEAGRLGCVSSSLYLFKDHLQPIVKPKLIPARAYLRCGLRSIKTVFPIGYCSIYTLTNLSSGFG